MMAELKTMKRCLTTFVFLCAIVGMATAAFAVPPNQVLSGLGGRTITGPCCFSWEEGVTVTEPNTVVPVVVTWSVNFQSTRDLFQVGISVNGHVCQIFGPHSLTDEPASVGVDAFRAPTLQWVILPSDGLIKGSNTLTLCGGDITLPEANGLTLGLRTLSVTIAK
jgi:hypothetical protein